MRSNRKSLILLLCMLTLLSACGGAEPENTITEEDVLMTYSVGTMVAGFFASQTAAVTPVPAITDTLIPTNTFLPTQTLILNTPPPPATWTPALIFYTSTLNIALTPSVTGTPPTATANTGALAFGCNNSLLVRDVNYPNGSTLSPGEGFVKTWKVENNGSCDWNYNYGMAVVSDPHFDSSWNRLGRDVAPGQWAEVSVILDAPDQSGTFTGSWRMTDAGGNPFGVTLSVTIVVP